MSSESPPAAPAQPGEPPTPGTGNARRNRGNRRSNGPTPRTFQGAVTALQPHVYDTGTIGSAELFTTTTRAIGTYAAREIKGAGDYRVGFDRLELPAITLPEMPTDEKDTKYPQNLKLWEHGIKSYYERTTARAELNKRVFALVIGQCSPTILDRLRAHEDWPAIDVACDPIVLLKLIRGSIYQRATRKHPALSLFEADQALSKFKQTERMTCSDYLEKFTEIVDVFEDHGGEVGTNRKRVLTFLKSPSDANDTAKYAAARVQARESYLALLLLMKSDTKRYGIMVDDMENDYTKGVNCYPATVAHAFDILTNYKKPRSTGSTNDGSGLTFYNEGDGGRGRGGRGRGGTGRGREGGRGGRGQGRGGRGPARGETQEDEENAHLNSAEPETSNDGTNDNNLNDAVLPPYIRLSRTVVTLANSHHSPHVSSTSLLLDTCSTGNLISNPHMLHDIHTVDQQITIHCNAGKMTLNQMGYLGQYPEPVW